MSETPLLVDPAVSRTKFDREVERFRALSDDHSRNGCWLAKAEFPTALVIFGTPKLTPPAVAFAAAFDFTNFDLWAPSVRLVNPFTQEPYKAKEVPTHLKRLVPAPPELAAQGVQGAVQNILQWYGQEDIPFLCLPGVREYHEHPGHSGDAWLLRRGGGEGTLYNLVTQLYRYGSEPIIHYQLAYAVKGFVQTEIPT